MEMLLKPMVGTLFWSEEVTTTKVKDWAPKLSLGEDEIYVKIFTGLERERVT